MAKKILFSDRHGLTQAVLEGRKTMTRRMVPLSLYNQTDWKSIEEGNYDAVVDGDGYYHDIRRCGNYQIGEEVAVAQTYKDCGWNPDVMQSTFVRKPTVFPDLDPISTHLGWVDLPFKYHKGWNNKMFVKADLMPHRIRITDIKVERLQDISDEDCLREGIVQDGEGVASYSFEEWIKRGFGDTVLPRRTYAATPRVAFAALIDRISGKGTWERNPWVLAYEFELIK